MAYFNRPAGGWLRSSADPMTGVCDECGEFTHNMVLEENLGCCSPGCVTERSEEAKKEEETFVPLNSFLPCRACSAYFDVKTSADGYHCSPACALNGPPFSGGVLPPPQPAPLEEWLALGHAAPHIPVSPTPSPPITPRVAAPSAAPLNRSLPLKRQNATSPAYEAEIAQKTTALDICQHWWPKNAPTPCPACHE